MKPRLAFCFLAALVAMGYGVYNVKYKVRELKVQSQKLAVEIRGDRESMQVLNAEWAYLIRPSRLEELATRYLGLAVLKPQQVASMNDIETVLPPVVEANAPPPPAEGTRLASVRKGK